jgi:hypothetical protein
MKDIFDGIDVTKTINGKTKRRIPEALLCVREICQNNTYPEIVFSFNARKNAYVIVTPQRTNCILL